MFTPLSHLFKSSASFSKKLDGRHYIFVATTLMMISFVVAAAPKKPSRQEARARANTKGRSTIPFCNGFPTVAPTAPPPTTAPTLTPVPTVTTTPTLTPVPTVTPTPIDACPPGYHQRPKPPVYYGSPSFHTASWKVPSKKRNRTSTSQAAHPFTSVPRPTETAVPLETAAPYGTPTTAPYGTPLPTPAVTGTPLPTPAATGTALPTPTGTGTPQPTETPAPPPIPDGCVPDETPTPVPTTVPTLEPPSSQKNSLVAGGVRVGRYYSSVASNPHQSEITAKLGDKAGQNVSFAVVPNDSAQNDEVKAGFATSDSETLVFSTTVQTDASGVARVVFNSGSRVGSETVRVTAGTSSKDIKFSVGEAEEKWTATAVDPDSEDDPIVRITLKYNSLLVSGHPISWKITGVTLPTDKKVLVNNWNKYVRFTGISATGQTISTTGAHDTPGEAAAYARFLLAPKQIDFDAVDTRIIPQQTPPPTGPITFGASPSGSISGVFSSIVGQRHEQVIELEYKKHIVAPLEGESGQFRERDVPGTMPSTNNVLGTDEEKALVTQGYKKNQILVPFGVKQEINIQFRVLGSFKSLDAQGNTFRTTSSRTANSVTVQAEDTNGDLLEYTRDLKTGIAVKTINGRTWGASPGGVDPVGSVKYFFDYFAPALADAWVEDNYTVKGKVGQVKRIYVTVKNLGIGFYNGGKGVVQLGVAAQKAQIFSLFHPREAWGDLQVKISTGKQAANQFRDPAIRQRLIDNVKKRFEDDYTVMYDDAVNANGEKFAAFAGEQGGEWMFNEVLGFGIGKLATLGKSGLKATNLYKGLGQKTVRVANIAVEGALKNTGRITKVVSPVVKQVGHVGEFTWDLINTKGKTVAQFTKEALGSNSAKISCYLKPAKGKAGGFVVLVKEKSGAFLGRVKIGQTEIPCQYARIFGKLKPETRQFIVEKIELIAKFVCFPAGTQIALPHHHFKSIERIHVGDLVMSRDEKTGKTSVQRVVHTFKKHTDSLIRLRLSNGETIRATPEHPFYVAKRGFTPARLLRVGTLLLTLSGKPARVIAATPLRRSLPVYNFEVKNTHTYFVGVSRVWVHNKCDWKDAFDSLIPEPSAFQDLDTLRRSKNLPIANRKDYANGYVAAKMDITDARGVQHSFESLNAAGGGASAADSKGMIEFSQEWNKSFSTLPNKGASFSSGGHAEINTFLQAWNKGVKGGKAILYIDSPPCNFCLSMPNLVRLLELDELIVVAPVKNTGGKIGRYIFRPGGKGFTHP